MHLILFICLFTRIVIATLNLKQIPFETRELFVPPLQEIAEVLDRGLQKYFQDIEVGVIDYPDLRQPPFGLASVGLNGLTRLVSIGGPQYLLPVPDLTRVYDIRNVLEVLNLDSGLVIGAGAGPHDYNGLNCEAAFNINIMDDKIEQHSRIIINRLVGPLMVERLPNNETRSDRIIDFFISQGKPGPVLKVYVRRRIGEDSFSFSIQKVLAEHFGNKVVGIGGTFMLLSGNASYILTPDFDKESLTDRITFNMSAPLTAFGTLITSTLGLELRPQHFHAFNDQGKGGHYLIDTTPDIVEYLGYFNTAEYVFRLDKPHVPLAMENWK